jgi:SAM-dependent methyltransferase
VVQLQSRQARVMVRNFYGVLRVNDIPAGAERPAMRQLRNGTIVHGAQILDVNRRDAPTTYFGPQSGAGIALRLLRQRGPIRVGVIGLGVGTLASYGRKGDRYTFYEINPLVIDLAKTQFDFVTQSAAQIDIIPGDARLSLERQSPQQFDVFLVDAFSGDAIPVHLLTREALELYFRHLKPQGVLAIHVSNRFLDLPPVVEAGARAVGARVVKVTSAEDQPSAIFQATWMLLDRPAQPGGPAAGDLLPPGKALQSEEEERTVRTWTDDYSNLLEILK